MMTTSQGTATTLPFILRRANKRGQANHGWLKSQHSFSFANYYDPKFMGFGPLRVINDDRIVGGSGFPPHAHRDMEILSYVVEGGLEHRDSMGNGSVIRPGELQRMSAGTGVRHSEYNHSSTDTTRFLQIWILPESRGQRPGYEQKDFGVEARAGALTLLASKDGRGGALTLRQDVDLWGFVAHPGDAATHRLAAGRRVWVQVVRGSVALSGVSLGEGDGVALNPQAGELELTITGASPLADVLVFDMA